MKYWMLPLLLFCAVSCYGQKKSASKFISVISPGALKQDLDVIAGAAMEGRQTGSAGQRRAADYIESQLRLFGVKPAVNGKYQMPFTVYQDSVAETGIRINGKDYQWDKDFGLYTDFNHACDMRLSEAVFAGYGISTDKYNDYKDLDVVGKLVVVYGGEPMHDSIYVLSGRKSFTAWSYPPPKVQAATRLGAAALLVIEKKFPLELYNYKASTLWRTPFKFYQGVNTFFISEEMARNIFKEKFDTITAWHKMDTLPKYKYQVTEVTLHYKRSLHTKEGANIIGVIEGSDKKDEYVILTAHYDHLGMRGDKIFYGANDNASGTTAMLKIAEAFAKAKAAGQGPRRTIVFMWTSGEENGLWGSDVYVNDPVYPLDKTSANVNMDMLGRISNEYAGDKDSLNNVYIIGPGILSSDLKPLLEKTTKNSTLKTDYKYNDVNDKNYYFFRSDQYNFAKMGVPALFFEDGSLADYHQHTDTGDKIRFDLLSKRAQLIFYTAWEIANSESMLKRDIPLPQ